MKYTKKISEIKDFIEEELKQGYPKSKERKVFRTR